MQLCLDETLLPEWYKNAPLQEAREIVYWLSMESFYFLVAASRVFISSAAMVISPTPPGTGVM